MRATRSSSLGVLFAAMAIVPVTNPVPATLVAVYPRVIRIGPARHNYVYMLHFVSGVYRCDKGSQWAPWAIGCSCSGTQMGQGLSGVTTRNPDIPWYIERVRAIETNIKINRKSGRELDRVGYYNMRRSLS